jgi:acetolactate synthase-1/2/3 large subunit
MVKYSVAVMQWLLELGYRHCYFVAGGNIMHLLNAARTSMICKPFVHEVAAGIAAEYHNETLQDPDYGKAFVLVTAGPGLTNTLTAIAGAYLESRELLILGGQAKTADLATNGLRQRGIQEVDGVTMASPVSVLAEQLLEPWDKQRFVNAVLKGCSDRNGPVFLEFPLDVQAVSFSQNNEDISVVYPPKINPLFIDVANQSVDDLADRLRLANRPVLLIGGGVNRVTAREILPQLRVHKIPTMTTWNASDRISVAEEFYCGRPNTWGQRSANIILQQADLIIALGTRLGLQQTGFNWQEFAPLAKVVQVEIDPAELKKGHPKVDLAIQGDANTLLKSLVNQPDLGNHQSWLEFSQQVRKSIPISEPINITREGYLNPFDFVLWLSNQCSPKDVIVPCSSGGAFTVMMQAFLQQEGQVIVTNKGLASMGYGLSGAIGACFANPDRRVILVEGDGGFCQNLQELATVSSNNLRLKTFIFSNEGYASIRMTQRNYFDGAYLGCDTKTGLGFPNWRKLIEAFDISFVELNPYNLDSEAFQAAWKADQPTCFIVNLDPEQTYFPKISSYITPEGSMRSNPLHRMSPDLDDSIEKIVMQYLNELDSGNQK